MEAHLKQIKTELKEICEKENFKYKHVKNHYQEMLEYHDFFALNRKKHFLVFKFIYQKQEESISFTYHFEYNNKTKTVNETHSLSNHEVDKLPGVSSDSIDLAKTIYQYEVVDGQIKNAVDLDKQTTNILSVFKNNYSSIITHVKNLSK